MNIFTKRYWKFLWQRWIRGFDDSETWSLDSTIVEFILPRLKRFKEVRKNSGLPSHIAEKFREGYELNQYGCIIDEKVRREQWDKAEKYWDDLLQKMIDAFQDIHDENYDFDAWIDKWNLKLTKAREKDKNFNLVEEQIKLREHGLKIFQENFFNLWW